MNECPWSRSTLRLDGRRGMSAEKRKADHVPHGVPRWNHDMRHTLAIGMGHFSGSSENSGTPMGRQTARLGPKRGLVGHVEKPQDAPKLFGNRALTRFAPTGRLGAGRQFAPPRAARGNVFGPEITARERFCSLGCPSGSNLFPQSRPGNDSAPNSELHRQHVVVGELVDQGADVAWRRAPAVA